MMAIQLPRVNLPYRHERLLTKESLIIPNMLLHEGILFKTADQLLRSHLTGTWRISMMAPWSLILFEFLEKKSVNENSLEAVFSSMSKTVGILWIFKHIDFFLCCESSLETYQRNNNRDVYNRINLSLCCSSDAVFSLGRLNSFIQHNYEVTSKQNTKNLWCRVWFLWFLQFRKHMLLFLLWRMVTVPYFLELYY